MQGALSDCHFKDGEMDGVGVVDGGWEKGDNLCAGTA